MLIFILFYLFIVFKSEEISEVLFVWFDGVLWVWILVGWCWGQCLVEGLLLCKCFGVGG